jgi:hypothetical protein
MAMSGLKLPEEHNKICSFMLKETSLMPTDGLRTVCSDAIMQVHLAANLGRLPSVVSALLFFTESELKLFSKHYSIL